MSTLKKPDLADTKLRAKLAKGMGHNYYGEPAWPNDLLYIFPVVILGTIACVVVLGVEVWQVRLEGLLGLGVGALTHEVLHTDSTAPTRLRRD